jgi:hypothetical protein
MKLNKIALTWIVVDVGLSAAVFAGGDTAVIGGWLFLIWTAPFGLFWWFYAYQYVLQWLSPETAQLIGTVLVDAIAFLFWFVAIPKMRAIKTARRKI